MQEARYNIQQLEKVKRQKDRTQQDIMSDMTRLYKATTDSLGMELEDLTVRKEVNKSTLRRLREEKSNIEQEIADVNKKMDE